MKKIKTLISLIAILSLILVSSVSCSKRADIEWSFHIDPAYGYKGRSESWDKMPEGYFDYIYTDPGYECDRVLKILLDFDYQYTFNDMSDEFKKEHQQFLNDYGHFDTSLNRDEMTFEELEIRDRRFLDLKVKAYEEAKQVARDFFETLNLETSIEPFIAGEEKWDNMSGFEYHYGYIEFNFNDYNDRNTSIEEVMNDFSNWEWHDKIEDFRKIKGIKKVYVRIWISPGGDCT